jgi:hypothetical protein
VNSGPIGHGFNIHGATSAQPAQPYKCQNLDYMATCRRDFGPTRESFQRLHNSGKQEARSTTETELFADLALIAGDAPELLEATCTHPQRRWSRATPSGKWVGEACKYKGQMLLAADTCLILTTGTRSINDDGYLRTIPRRHSASPVSSS